MTLRMICNSRTYQLSVVTNPLNQDDSLNYSHAIPRRLPAEVIYDAVHALTGAVSSIPGVPKGTRATALTDAGVRLPDGFLQQPGTPGSRERLRVRTQSLRLAAWSGDGVDQRPHGRHGNL